MSDLEAFFKTIPEITVDEPTFMEIGGYQYRENTYSNILRFYLNPKNNHGYDRLILDTFLEAANLSDFIDYDAKSIEITREFPTDEGRIDLLITTNNWVLAIENKIYHTLNNNLDEYFQYVSSKYSQTHKVQIVLSIHREENAKDFHNLLYIDFVRALEKIENLQTTGNDYQIYFKHFYNQLKKITMQNPMSKEELQFYHANINAIEEVEDLQLKYNGYKNFRVDNLIKLIGKIEGVRAINYQGGDVVMVFNKEGIEFKLECPIYRQNTLGITLATSGNKAGRNDFLPINYFKNNPFNPDKSSVYQDRYILENEINFFISDEELAQKIKNWTLQLIA
jgi:hypothetical protein